MSNTSGTEDYQNRPILTAEELERLSKQLKAPKCLLSLQEFVKLFEIRYPPGEITPRTVQLYCSQEYRLLTPPILKGGNVSYYLHPEHTTRMEAILILQQHYYLPLKVIAQVLKNFPMEYFVLIQLKLLTAEDLLDFGAYIKEGRSVQDVIFFKICELLGGLENCFMKGSKPEIAELAEKDPAAFHKHLGQIYSKRAQELVEWIKAEKFIKGFLEPTLDDLPYPREITLARKDPNDPNKTILEKVSLDDPETLKRVMEIIKKNVQEGEG